MFSSAPKIFSIVPVHVLDLTIRLQTLSENFREVFLVLHDFANRFDVVRPSTFKIAALAGCCRDTVNRAFKLFKELGWATHSRRWNDSNLYYIPDWIIDLPLRDPRLYRSQKKSLSDLKSDTNQSLSLVSNKSIRYIYTKNKDGDLVKKDWNLVTKNRKKKLQPKDYIKWLPFSLRDKKLLEINFLPIEIAQACELFKTFHTEPKKPIAAFWALCKKIKQKRTFRSLN